MKEEQQRDTLTVLLALGFGVMLGKNWPQIQKNIQPILQILEKQYGNAAFATLGAMTTQKENIEDMIAQWQASQKGSGKGKKNRNTPSLPKT